MKYKHKMGKLMNRQKDFDDLESRLKKGRKRPGSNKKTA